MRLIAVTGWGRVEDKLQATEAGFDAHLIKPVEPEHLQALLTHLDRLGHSPDEVSLEDAL